MTKLIQPAYTLLAQRIDEGLRDRINAEMPAGNKLKWTHTGRFDELDGLTLEAIVQQLADRDTVEVHDMAASSAVTSAHLFKRIAAVRPVKLHASDYYHVLKHIRLGGVDVVFDADNRPLQIAVGRWGAPAKLLPSLARLAKGRIADATQISLFHPEAIYLAETDARFTLGRADAFVPTDARFDVVRVLNLIGPEFTNEQNRQILTGAFGTVRAGGILVAGRHRDYSVLKVNGDRLTTLAQLGEGLRTDF